MSELIQDVGHFRGRATAGAVSLTTNGFPQLVLELHATDVYDGEAGEWYPDAVDGIITGYFCLFGGKGDATLAVQQVIEAFGWDGASFKGLNELVKDLTSRPDGHPVGFSTKENVYEGNTTIQASWVRAFDAEPGRAIRECTTDELKALDKQYARGLQAAKGKAKVTAPKPAAPPKPPRVPTPEAINAASVHTETTPPPVTKPTPAATGKSTKGKAWGVFTTANRAEAIPGKTGGGAGFKDEQLAEIWTATAGEVAGVAANDKSITREQWYQIQEICKTKVTLTF